MADYAQGTKILLAAEEHSIDEVMPVILEGANLFNVVNFQIPRVTVPLLAKRTLPVCFVLGVSVTEGSLEDFLARTTKTLIARIRF